MPGINRPIASDSDVFVPATGTDGEILILTAEQDLALGAKVWVHWHLSSEPCNDHCLAWCFQHGLPESPRAVKVSDPRG
jgi:hypothetical protein